MVKKCPIITAARVEMEGQIHIEAVAIGPCVALFVAPISENIDAVAHLLEVFQRTEGDPWSEDRLQEVRVSISIQIHGGPIVTRPSYSAEVLDIKTNLEGAEHWISSGGGVSQEGREDRSSDLSADLLGGAGGIGLIVCSEEGGGLGIGDDHRDGDALHLTGARSIRILNVKRSGRDALIVGLVAHYDPGNFMLRDMIFMVMESPAATVSDEAVANARPTTS
jgi:hypothetical protein